MGGVSQVFVLGGSLNLFWWVHINFFLCISVSNNNRQYRSLYMLQTIINFRNSFLKRKVPGSIPVGGFFLFLGGVA